MEKYLRISALNSGDKREILNKLRDKRYSQIGRKWMREANLIRRGLHNIYPDFDQKPINPEEGD